MVLHFKCILTTKHYLPSQCKCPCHSRDLINFIINKKNNSRATLKYDKDVLFCLCGMIFL